ncbi:DUF6922 domain-containing protein [Gelidibacter salicanalis]|uniref:DUF6922 domain-containing protein n=1 Tax=Gelidibacter salicanalis TaxID=291193 RepID=UPI003F758C2D
MRFFKPISTLRKKKSKLKKNTPDLTLLRKSLFWDTDISKIDWRNQSLAVINRIFERGNDIEKEEIKRFYKSSKINEALSQETLKPYTIYKNKNKA